MKGMIFMSTNIIFKITTIKMMLNRIISKEAKANLIKFSKIFRHLYCFCTNISIIEFFTII